MAPGFFVAIDLQMVSEILGGDQPLFFLVKAPFLSRIVSEREASR
jgi:hypothetical protein